MNIHLVQHDIVWENPSLTCAHVAALLKKVEFSARDLIVLPEMFSTGFSMNAKLIGEAEDGVTSTFLSDLARETACYVIGGVPLIARSGRVQNQAACINPQGDVIARYAKMQPFTPAGEGENFEAGAAPAVFDWNGLKVAPLICYDLRFPEVFRAATRRGAEMFCLIASWPAARSAHRDILLPARALENLAYVAGLNRVGRDPNCEYNGQSGVIDPLGNWIVRAGETETVLSCEIDPNVVRSARAKFPWLRDMRDDLVR